MPLRGVGRVPPAEQCLASCSFFLVALDIFFAPPAPCSWAPVAAVAVRLIVADVKDLRACGCVRGSGGFLGALDLGGRASSSWSLWRTHPWMSARVPRLSCCGGLSWRRIGGGPLLVGAPAWSGRLVVPGVFAPAAGAGWGGSGGAGSWTGPIILVWGCFSSSRAAASKAASQAAGRPRASILNSAARRSSPPLDFSSRGRSMNAPHSDHPWRSGRPLSP